MKRLSRPFDLLAVVAIGFCAAGAANAQPSPLAITGGSQVLINLNTLTPLNITRSGSIATFSIGANDITRFVQQSGSSATLGRVIGANPAIVGNLQSNGRVILISPNGVLFGGNTTPSVTGVIAPGKSMEVADPKSPGITVEIKAPANNSINVQQFVDALGKRDIISTLGIGGGMRAATMAVRDESGRIMLTAGQ